MQNALGLHKNFNVIYLDIEEPARLNELKPLVHHGRGVDGHLVPHIPGRMAQRIFQRYFLKLFSRIAAEGTAGSRQQNFPDSILLVAAKTLKNSRVLRIHRQYLDTFPRGERHDEMPRADQRFFICERNVLALTYRRYRRLNAYHADDSRDKRLRLCLGRDLQKALVPRTDSGLGIGNLGL